MHRPAKDGKGLIVDGVSAVELSGVRMRVERRGYFNPITGKTKLVTAGLKYTATCPKCRRWFDRTDKRERICYCGNAPAKPVIDRAQCRTFQFEPPKEPTGTKAYKFPELLPERSPRRNELKIPGYAGAAHTNYRRSKLPLTKVDGKWLAANTTNEFWQTPEGKARFAALKKSDDKLLGSDRPIRGSHDPKRCLYRWIPSWDKHPKPADLLGLDPSTPYEKMRQKRWKRMAEQAAEADLTWPPCKEIRPRVRAALVDHHGDGAVVSWTKMMPGFRWRHFVRSFVPSFYTQRFRATEFAKSWARFADCRSQETETARAGNRNRVAVPRSSDRFIDCDPGVRVSYRLPPHTLVTSFGLKTYPRSCIECIVPTALVGAATRPTRCCPTSALLDWFWRHSSEYARIDSSRPPVPTEAESIKQRFGKDTLCSMERAVPDRRLIDRTEFGFGAQEIAAALRMVSEIHIGAHDAWFDKDKQHQCVVWVGYKTHPPGGFLDSQSRSPAPLVTALAWGRWRPFWERRKIFDDAETARGRDTFTYGIKDAREDRYDWGEDEWERYDDSSSAWSRGDSESAGAKDRSWHISDHGEPCGGVIGGNDGFNWSMRGVPLPEEAKKEIKIAVSRYLKGSERRFEEALRYQNELIGAAAEAYYETIGNEAQKTKQAIRAVWRKSKEDQRYSNAECNARHIVMGLTVRDLSARSEQAYYDRAEKATGGPGKPWNRAVGRKPSPYSAWGRWCDADMEEEWLYRWAELSFPRFPILHPEPMPVAGFTCRVCGREYGDSLYQDCIGVHNWCDGVCLDCHVPMDLPNRWFREVLWCELTKQPWPALNDKTMWDYWTTPRHFGNLDHRALAKLQREAAETFLVGRRQIKIQTWRALLGRYTELLASMLRMLGVITPEAVRELSVLEHGEDAYRSPTPKI